MTQIFRYSLAFLIVPTVIFAVLKYHYFIIRGLINIDYILAGLATALAGPVLGGLAFATALLFDIMVSFAPAFHFKEGGFLESVGELMDIEADYVLFVATCIIFGTALYTLASLKIAGKNTHKIHLAASLVVILLLAISFDALSTGNALKKGDTALIKTNITTSSTFESFRNLYRWSRHTPPTELEDIAAAVDPVRNILSQSPDNLPQNIVLIVLESWGLFNDEQANTLQASILNDPRLVLRYNITIDRLPFYYSTVPAELRELCGVLMPTIDPEVENIPASRCLPIQLGQQGYYTVGAHGFAGNFFNRHTWYPDLGFDEVLFARDMDKVLGRRERCGVALSGLCDADVMELLRGRLLAEPDKKQFLYWLTLNGHTPFPEPNGRYPHLDCSASEPTGKYESVCRLAGVHHIVLSSVVETALNPNLPETAFILVGDHAPPFVEQHTRRLFSHEKVPYAILWPKSKPVSLAYQ